MDVVMLSSIPLMQVLKNPGAIHRKARRICKVGLAGVIITKQVTSYGEKDFAVLKGSKGAEAIMKTINKAYLKENEDRLCEQTTEALLAGNLEEAQRINDIIFGVDRELLSKKEGRKPANKGRKAVAPIEPRAELAAPAVFENSTSVSIMGATSADFGASVLAPVSLEQPAAVNTAESLPTLNDFHQALSGGGVDSLWDGRAKPARTPEVDSLWDGRAKPARTPEVDSLSGRAQPVHLEEDSLSGQLAAVHLGVEDQVPVQETSLLTQLADHGDTPTNNVLTDDYTPAQEGSLEGVAQEYALENQDFAQTHLESSAPAVVDDPLKDLVMIPPTRPQPRLDPSLEKISENLRAKGFKPWHSR